MWRSDIQQRVLEWLERRDAAGHSRIASPDALLLLEVGTPGSQNRRFGPVGCGWVGHGVEVDAEVYVAGSAGENCAAVVAGQCSRLC